MVRPRKIPKNFKTEDWISDNTNGSESDISEDYIQTRDLANGALLDHCNNNLPAASNSSQTTPFPRSLYTTPTVSESSRQYEEAEEEEEAEAEACLLYTSPSPRD